MHLFSKGLFIVNFASSKEQEIILQEGPWFWGSTELFLTLWFPDFDANTMIVSRMLVWFMLHNLLLHLWHNQVLESIENILGRYIKTCIQRMEEQIYIFVRICMEVDLSKGLPDHIQLTHNK